MNKRGSTGGVLGSNEDIILILARISSAAADHRCETGTKSIPCHGCARTRGDITSTLYRQTFSDTSCYYSPAFVRLRVLICFAFGKPFSIPSCLMHCKRTVSVPAVSFFKPHFCLNVNILGLSKPKRPILPKYGV